jgi:pyruvate carboxylase
MYPKVFEDYCATQVKYGPVASLPTMVFLYGMRAGEEIAVDLDPGKRLFIRLQALGDTEEDGQVKAFFELNGQPRVVRVPDRKAKALVPARRKGDGGNPNHVVAPMPGSIASVLVKPDDAVRAGDLLVVLEAMKMETAVYAPHDGLIVEVTCKPGDVADAKDLLIVLSKRQ